MVGVISLEAVGSPAKLVKEMILKAGVVDFDGVEEEVVKGVGGRDRECAIHGRSIIELNNSEQILVRHDPRHARGTGTKQPRSDKLEPLCRGSTACETVTPISTWFHRI